MAKRCVPGLLLCALLLAPGSASAQDVPLSQLLVTFIQSDIRLAPPPPGFRSHEAHFLPGVDQRLAPYFFNQQIVTQLATFPIGSPSGGFSFTFDPAAGTFQRATDSFGPSFAERALTNGQGRLTIGANFQYSKYSSFEGDDLDDGSIRFYLRHQDVGGIFFEGDLVQTALNLDLSSSTTTIFGNYGLTDQWDVAVAIPIVHVSMDATVDATVLRIASGENSNLHSFPNGGTTASFSQSGSATGVGDILVRTKYRFLSTPGGGLAAGLDLRLPSGDAENLLGTGAAAATITLIGSSSYGRLSPHFNVGYAGSGEGDVVNIPNEFGYRFGTEFAASPTVTLSADFIGRTLLDAGRLELQDVVWNYENAAGDHLSTTFQEYNSIDASLTLSSVAVGGKVNVTGNLIVSGNLLLALTSSGVTARVTPVVGFDYTF